MIKTFQKEQGGYALAYVMIVILVIMSVVMIVCTTAMKNYEAQQDSVARMADKYAAEGEIEKQIAVIKAINLESIVTGSEADVIAAYKTATGQGEADWSIDANGNHCVELRGESGGIVVTAGLSIQLTLSQVDAVNYKVGTATVSIDSYTVNAEVEAAPAESGESGGAA